MIVGRNDLCPCGSGKKYKKCCLQKENVTQIQEYKIERFYQQKHKLVQQLEEFIYERIPNNLYYHLRR